MEVYSSENEQREALMRFLADNGKALVIGVIIGIAALVGWRYWHNHQNDEMMASSASWQQVNTALTTGAAQQQIDDAATFANGHPVLAQDVAHSPMRVLRAK